MLAEHTLSEGMKCADVIAEGPHRDEDIHTLLHLLGSLFGKCKGQDFLGTGKLGLDQVSDPVGDDERLAGPRPGDDQKRALWMFDRFVLLGGEDHRMSKR